jgi:hypothetical protein
MDRIRNKLREATFFLGNLAERSRLAFGDREEFDFYISAFLSAARSLDYRFRHEEGPTYSTFRAAWDTAFSTDGQALVKFMVDDRNLEIHEGGSSRVQAEERVAIGSSYRDASGTVTVAAPIGVPTELVKHTFSFLMNGKPVPVVESCASYLEILKQLVADYFRHVGVA